ncbi:hypothetical protein FH972_021375 [Carpinus fangiana]|uniref:Uncharacterized protein n=1 Tax=Carpinus fangiana TaxID=176857 RepID=A0A5N6KP83_9ROSI|nr:hypothetical protein FH972_021375 [Carpinus fangiana]
MSGNGGISVKLTEKEVTLLAAAFKHGTLDVSPVLVLCKEKSHAYLGRLEFGCSGVWIQGCQSCQRNAASPEAQAGRRKREVTSQIFFFNPKIKETHYKCYRASDYCDQRGSRRVLDGLI